MATKRLEHKRRKVAPKRSATVDTGIVLVGTYKERQLAWIKKHGIYNYPVKEGDLLPDESCQQVGELWLYADVKSTRHAFSAGFVGKMSREDFLAAYPTYAKLGPAKSKAYYVFKTAELDYGPLSDGQIVVARTVDFGGRSAKVKKAIERFKADGEFAPLVSYLPSDLAKVPHRQLRVCEAAVQMDFFCTMTEPDVRVPYPSPEAGEFTFIDLFAGVGGFRLAMQGCGGRCVFSSEWDQSAQDTYARNYGERPFGDITKEETKAAIPETFDVLCGGFPCQPFSLAGVSARTSLNKKHGFEDKTQGTLFFDIMQIVRRHHPKVLFLENVKNLVNHDEGRTFKVIKESIESEGYSFNYRVIDASPLVPQKRLRCYMVCVRDGGKFSFPKIEGEERKLSTILEKDVPASFTISDGLWAGHQRRTQNNLARGTGFTAFTADVNKPAHTLVARYYKDGKECLIPQKGKNPRMLTPRECARLQGFPEWFILPTAKSKAYKQMGNSVAVPVLREIAKCICSQVLENEREGR